MSKIKSRFILYSILLVLLSMFSVSCLASKDVTPHKIQKILAILKGGRIVADYYKPVKKDVYSVVATPEFADYKKFETTFYAKFRKKLNLHNMRKVDYKDKLVFSNGHDEIQYFKTTGAVIYTRGLSEKKLNNSNMERMKKASIDFIIKYGGGLPKDAALTQFFPIQIINNTTGKIKPFRCLLNYSRKYQDLKVAGLGADIITIDVDDGGITFYKKLWRNFKLDKKIAAALITDEVEALNKNISQILSTLAWISVQKDQLYKITEVNLVYVGSRFNDPVNTITLAWEYKCEDLYFYIDAITGDFLEKQTTFSTESGVNSLKKEFEILNKNKNERLLINEPRRLE